MNNRGNQVTISGPMDSVEAARDALDRLYRAAGGGHNVDQAEVDAAVRMAEGADNDGAAGAEPFIQTRRKRIDARSPNQAHYIRTIKDHEMVFATGPAGTGKTYLAVCAAVEMLTAGRMIALMRIGVPYFLRTLRAPGKTAFATEGTEITEAQTTKRPCRCLLCVLCDLCGSFC